MSKNHITAFLVLLVLATVACADEAQPPVDAKIRALIERLASPNPKPITGDEDKSVAPEYRLPPGFDKAKQELVRQARVDLYELGLAAFPQLIEHWSDDRHCMTMFHSLSEYSHNVTVGFVCRKIVFDQIQPYSLWPRTGDDPRGKPKRPAYPHEYLGSKLAAQQWWDKHKNKPLFDLQLEVLDWVIAEEAKRPEDYTDDEKEFVVQVRKELLRRKVPMAPGNYDWMNPEL